MLLPLLLLLLLLLGRRWRRPCPEDLLEVTVEVSTEVRIAVEHSKVPQREPSLRLRTKVSTKLTCRCRNSSNSIRVKTGAAGARRTARSMHTDIGRSSSRK